MRKILLTAAAVLAVSAPAHAVSFFSLGAVNTPSGKADPGLASFETLLVGFQGSDSPLVTTTLAGTNGFYTGTTQGLAAAPVGDTSQYLALGTGGSAKIDFSNYFSAQQRQVRSLSVYVGSVDGYNRIQVLKLDGSVLKTIDGADLPGQDGDQGSSRTNRRLYINFDPSEQVGALLFSSTGVAFEFDTIGASSAQFAISPNDTVTPNDMLPAVTGVPEPTTWSLMIGGFGLVGGALRRRARPVLRNA